MISAMSQASVSARRVQGDCLQLSLQVPQALQVQVRLLCFQSGWVFKQDLGVAVPGEDRREIRPEAWPSEATLVQVTFSERGVVLERMNRWLVTPALT